MVVDDRRRAIAGDSSREFERLVFGAIVKDQEIKIVGFLREDASKRFAQVRRAVEGRYGNGQSRGFVHENTLGSVNDRLGDDCIPLDDQGR